jgi:hypothetical protein
VRYRFGKNTRGDLSGTVPSASSDGGGQFSAGERADRSPNGTTLKIIYMARQGVTIMKNMKLIRAALLVVALFTLGAVTVWADSPADAGPSSAVPIDNQSHTLAANSVAWYRFDYQILDDGSRPVRVLTLVNATNSGLGFQVWTGSQLANLANNLDDARADTVHNQPIGAGTAASINCDTGKLDGAGECKSNDLTWTGAFGTSGTYYVRVANIANSPRGYTLTVK